MKKLADGLVCKLWLHYTQSVQFHIPWKVSAPVQCQERFNPNFEKIFLDILVI